MTPYEPVNERILKRYCGCLFVDGKSNGTIAQYKRTCLKLAEATGKTFPEIGVYDIRFFLANEKSRGLYARSVENQRANLSAFFQWMTQEELIPKNPCLNIKPIKYTDEIRLPFSEVEIDALRGACNTLKERAIIEILLSTGIRVSELSALRVDDINMHTMAVHIRHGKGDKARITYATNVAMKHFTTYLDQRSEGGELAFYNAQHNALLSGGVRYILKTIASRAGVENVHPHRFRRTFASGLAARGMPVQEIQLLLGHSNVNTTMEYVYVNDQKVGYSYKQYIA